MKIALLEETGALERIAKKLKPSVSKGAVQFGGMADFLQAEIQKRIPQPWVDQRDDGLVDIVDANHSVRVDPTVALEAIQQLPLTPVYEDLWAALGAVTAELPQEAPAAAGVAARKRANDPDNFSEVLREMMDAWDTLLANIRAEYPNLDDEEIFQIASEAMRSSLRR